MVLTDTDGAEHESSEFDWITPCHDDTWKEYGKCRVSHLKRQRNKLKHQQAEIDKKLETAIKENRGQN